MYPRLKYMVVMMGRNKRRSTMNFGDSGASSKPPLDSDEFRGALDRNYPSAADTREAITMAIDDVWPVVTDGDVYVSRDDVDEEKVSPTLSEQDDFKWHQSYRENQREAITDILANLYIADKDVVSLSAPTGAGKSLILHAAMSVVYEVCDRHSFFTTPLNALIDQVDNDEFMKDDVVTLKGKNNYNCVHRQDRGTPVDKAVCQRVDDFECEHKEQHYENGGCPYYGRKNVADTHEEVVTNMSYMMANSMIPDEYAISNKEIVTVDECQKIEDFGLGYVSLTVSQITVPLVWDQIGRPPKGENIDELREWLQQDVHRRVASKLEEFETKPELTEQEADKKDKLQNFVRKVENFLGDSEEHHWVAETEYEDDGWSVEFNPIKVGRFMEKFLWSQGNKVILSSATIPKGGFLNEVGLDDRDVAEVEVKSTFPPARRAVITEHAVGKMTYEERDKNIPKVASKIADIARHHEGKRGFVHCHSYPMAARLYKHLPSDVKGLTRVQNQDDREEALDAWLRADVDESSHDAPRDVDDREIGGQVFLSVAMDEGISLDGDSARWQVVAKAAYPFLNDKRVSYRVRDMNDWTWYSGKAAIALQQAVGRGMRSRDDWCHTYILDKSAVDLIDRNEYLFEDWFMSAVDIDFNAVEESWA